MEGNSTTRPSDTSKRDPVYCEAQCKMILITLYTIVFLGGTTGVVMMSRMMFKRNSQSMISIIILNIIVLHSVLLISLPFRLSYYVLDTWYLGSFTCRLASSIIYAHMYFSFIFYVAIVMLRLLIYFKKLQTQQLQKYHAVVLSTMIWTVGSLIFLPIFSLHYGIDSIDSKQSRCFMFYRDLSRRDLVILNYSFTVLMITTVVILFLIQMAVIIQQIKTLWPENWTHQEYRAQIKSFFFLVVIVACFLPHHTFRIHFIQNFSESKNSERKNSELVLYNEIFVALTTMCCLDMLCFIGGVIH
ncbi:probable G-protein coupled receptor 141 [Erinaceus europaeus]|uniref:Probable G-protein coupled receptor 141 n=1 Tax=Erinaceus europaeus TaxID=9365 RepID=A0ABM3XSN8_ERIEU|nr:probable G-protein coupled receptor 141 [Erinaceus europaeus]XP_060051836.1 probable G-protein coupled receptor 141 [Erinaceus europaeus]